MTQFADTAEAAELVARERTGLEPRSVVEGRDHFTVHLRDSSTVLVPRTPPSSSSDPELEGRCSECGRPCRDHTSAECPFGELAVDVAKLAAAPTTPAPAAAPAIAEELAVLLAVPGDELKPTELGTLLRLFLERLPRQLRRAGLLELLGALPDPELGAEHSELADCYLPFGDDKPLEPGELREFEMNPQVPFIPQRLICPLDDADGFEIMRVLFGRNSQEMAWSERGIDARLYRVIEFPRAVVLVPGLRIAMHVRNTAAERQCFSAVLVGIGAWFDSFETLEHAARNRRPLGERERAAVAALTAWASGLAESRINDLCRAAGEHGAGLLELLQCAASVAAAELPAPCRTPSLRKLRGL